MIQKTYLSPIENELDKMSAVLMSIHSHRRIEECNEGKTVAIVKKLGFNHLPIFGGRMVDVWQGDSDDGES